MIPKQIYVLVRWELKERARTERGSQETWLWIGQCMVLASGGNGGQAGTGKVLQGSGKCGERAFANAVGCIRQVATSGGGASGDADREQGVGMDAPAGYSCVAGQHSADTPVPTPIGKSSAWWSKPNWGNIPGANEANEIPSNRERGTL